jgi:hypothetical protein
MQTYQQQGMTPAQQAAPATQQAAANALVDRPNKPATDAALRKNVFMETLQN